VTDTRRTSRPRQRALAEDWLAGPPRERTRISDADRRKKQRQHQLFLRRIKAIVAIAIVAVGAFGLHEIPRLPIFNVTQIEISGTSAVPDPTVRRAIDPLISGETIYTADMEQIRDRVADLPFVRRVDVQHHLPGGISIDVVEYEPLAFGVAGNGGWLIARDGRVLSKARIDDWREAIPLVRIDRKKVHPGDRIGSEPTLQLIRAIPPTFPGNFESIDRTSTGYIGTLTDGLRIRFGNVGQFEEKLMVAGRLLEIFGPVHRRELSYLDVSVPSRPATKPL
jgi:cell division protein FtsQ